MSGYTDDYEDRGDREPEPERDDRIITRAKARVSGPAIALLVSGVISILAAGFGVFCYLSPAFHAAFDDAYAKEQAKYEEQWDKDPRLTPQQRQEMKRSMVSSRDSMKSSMPLGAALAFISGLLSTISAILMMRSTGRGFAIFGSLMSMLPCVNTCCCLIGLPVGIWALVVLLKSDVKAGFLAAKQAKRGPREDY